MVVILCGKPRLEGGYIAIFAAGSAVWADSETFTLMEREKHYISLFCICHLCRGHNVSPGLTCWPQGLEASGGDLGSMWLCGEGAVPSSGETWHQSCEGDRWCPRWESGAWGGAKVLCAHGASLGDCCEHAAIQDSWEQIEPGELHFFSEREPGSTLET